MTPSSRGTVRLASSDPITAPLIRLPKVDAAVETSPVSGMSKELVKCRR